MWDLLGPGLEPVSPALAGGFLTTAPQKSPCSALTQNFIYPRPHPDPVQLKSDPV